MRELVLTVCVVVAVVVSGLVHGSWTDRWEKSQALEEAVARLAHVPSSLGTWQGEDLDMDPRQFERAGVAGYQAMRYVDPFDKSNLSVLLVAGRSGPVGVHTPDVCYGGAGYEMLGQPVRHAVPLPGGRPDAEFWVVRFRKQGLGETSHLRVFWSWSTDGREWSAPDSPRSAFGRMPALSKLYVVREMITADEPLEEDPALDLIRRFLQEFGKPVP